MTTIQQTGVKTRLAVIALELGKLYSVRAGAALEVENSETDISDRATQLIPPGGWPGKNEAERKAAQLTAEAADDKLQMLRADLRAHRAEQADILADIDGLEAERRALEWGIRADMVQAIGGRTDRLPDNGPAWDESADDTLEVLYG